MRNIKLCYQVGSTEILLLSKLYNLTLWRLFSIFFFYIDFGINGVNQMTQNTLDRLLSPWEHMREVIVPLKVMVRRSKYQIGFCINDMSIRISTRGYFLSWAAAHPSSRFALQEGTSVLFGSLKKHFHPGIYLSKSLLWHHDGWDGVSNHQPHDC